MQDNSCLKKLSEEIINETADLFKIFGDATRMRILLVLQGQELCVYYIVQELGMTQSAISHQLRILKQNRLVKSRREGKSVYYSLDDDHVSLILSIGLEHVME